MELCTAGSLYDIIEKPENAHGMSEHEFTTVMIDICELLITMTLFNACSQLKDWHIWERTMSFTETLSQVTFWGVSILTGPTLTSWQTLGQQESLQTLTDLVPSMVLKNTSWVVHCTALFGNTVFWLGILATCHHPIWTSLMKHFKNVKKLGKNANRCMDSISDRFRGVLGTLYWLYSYYGILSLIYPFCITIYIT